MSGYTEDQERCVYAGDSGSECPYGCANDCAVTSSGVVNCLSCNKGFKKVQKTNENGLTQTVCEINCQIPDCSVCKLAGAKNIICDVCNDGFVSGADG